MTIIKTSHKTCIALLFCALAASAQAAPEPEAPAPEEIICPELLTEQECRTHQDTLARLRPGPARSEYLRQIQALVAERRQSCDCRFLRAASNRQGR